MIFIYLTKVIGHSHWRVCPSVCVSVCNSAIETYFPLIDSYSKHIFGILMARERQQKYFEKDWIRNKGNILILTNSDLKLKSSFSYKVKESLNIWFKVLSSPLTCPLSTLAKQIAKRVTIILRMMLNNSRFWHFL